MNINEFKEELDTIEIIDEDFNIDDEWRSQTNAEVLFKDILTKKEITVLGNFNVRKDHLEDGRLRITLYAPEEVVLQEFVYDPEEDIDLQWLADVFMQYILQHTGLMCAILNLWSRLYVRMFRFNGRVLTQAIFCIAATMVDGGGYFHIQDKKERKAIFAEAYKALKKRRPMRLVERMNFSEDQTVRFYDRLAERVGDKIMRENNKG